MALQRYMETYADFDVSTGGNSIFKDGLQQNFDSTIYFLQQAF
jgi:hypothetical protein